MILVALVLVVVFSIFLLFNMPFDDFTGRSGKRQHPRIESIDWDNSTGQIKAYVWNHDNKDITLSQIYVNGALDDNSVFVPQVLAPNQTVEITLSETYPIMPKQITIEIHDTENNFRFSRERTFIGFKMLRFYWDENTGKIKVLVRNIGDYQEVNFGEVYVNGTLDESAVITKKDNPDRRGQKYEISLSGIYVSKPTKMLLKIATVDGKSFELESPFTGMLHIDSISWFESTGEIKFLVGVGRFEEERTITFDAVYVNGTLDESAVITRLYDSQTYVIALSGTYANCPSEVTVKVITDFGAFGEAYDDNLTG